MALGKTVRRFQVLTSPAGSTAQARSFNENRDVVVNVTHADSTSALIHFAIP
jgi:hypothetical protein